MTEIRFRNPIYNSCHVSDTRIIGVFGASLHEGTGLTNKEIADRIINPIGSLPLAALAKNKHNILIVTDDNTRQTPCQRILPIIFAELESAGVRHDEITILIGLGTHRPMSIQEIGNKFGAKITSEYRIVNHRWNDATQLVFLGICDLGYEVIVNRMVKDADLIITVGSILPHATTGYSGGGKAIVPGICGNKTIADTHWAALEYDMRDIIGNPTNKIRDGINAICKKIGTDIMIVNAIMHGDDDRVYDLVAGDIERAHLRGAAISKELHGVAVPKRADIVIAEAYPMDIDLRQAIKAVCSADIVCRDNGVVILVAECREGIAPQFPEFVEYGFNNPDKLYQEVECGTFSDKLMAYTLVAIGRIIKRVRVILITPCISENEAQQVGFHYAPTVQEGIDMARSMTPSDASILALQRAAEILPILAE